MSIRSKYSQWFEEATGFEPYGYQGELAERTVPPSILQVPTGSGKTQGILGAWLYQRLTRDSGPRRLVYALPMRSLVEQTRDVALEMRRQLGRNPDELPIHVLMGGEDLRKDDWRLRPEADQILIGTIDMLLSRAINRGYGEGRFEWPISFGLLNSDCRWVFDEVQLMGPARTTSAQLDGLRAALGTTLPCETVWVSATVDPEALRTVDRQNLGAVLSLPGADRDGALQKRLTASKLLERTDLSEAKATPKAIAELAAQRHRRGTRTLVVLNTVEAAQATFAALRKLTDEDRATKTVLLHSRFRPGDREAHMRAAIAEPESGGTIVVSTQVIEAGVDTSCRTLLTETAPFSSIVQRLGRCNRAGEHPKASVLWLDRGELSDDAAGRKLAAPYLPQDLASSRNALLELEGESLSPQALERIDVAETPDEPAVLRRRDLIDLFDTGPDLSGTDIDIAPFIREDDQRSVLAFFREIDPDAKAVADQPLPTRREIVQVPRSSLGRRSCWKADHVEGIWMRVEARGLPPGSTVMLDAAEGGYTPELGWRPESEQTVEAVDIPLDHRVEGWESERLDASRQELLPHLEEVREEAAAIAERLALDTWADALVAAAALHDIGKAHTAFQATLRRAMEIDGDDDRLWAKSDELGHHERRFLRHELAGALALRELNGAFELPARDLTIYLVAAHHGRVRLSIRPAPGETQPEAGECRFALGIIEGESLPAVETPLGRVAETTLDLGCMELGAEGSWTSAAVALRDAPDLGPFRLAFLEATLRMADWRAGAGV
jgi:CRISPR-associated endonuclease/helicase Cas3